MCIFYTVFWFIDTHANDDQLMLDVPDGGREKDDVGKDSEGGVDLQQVPVDGGKKRKRSVRGLGEERESKKRAKLNVKKLIDEGEGVAVDNVKEDEDFVQEKSNDEGEKDDDDDGVVEKTWSMSDLIEYPSEGSRLKNRTCIACPGGKLFATFTKLRDHFRFKHCGVSYDCDSCWPVKRYQNERDYRDHVDKMHIKTHEYKYECSIVGCNASFKKEGGLEAHVRMHHPTTKFKCDKCSREYSTVYLLRDHKCGGDAAVRYTCTLCCKNFFTKSDFAHHNLYTHKTGDVVVFRCVHCNKGFGSPSARSFHVRSCSGSSTSVRSSDA